MSHESVGCVGTPEVNLKAKRLVTLLRKTFNLGVYMYATFS